MKRALLICPGRGSYNPAELGYLRRGARAAADDLVAVADELRRAEGLPAIRELDAAARFDPALHLATPHASPLIFTCSAVDAELIGDDYEIVAIAGNSMGWYTALYVSGSLDFHSAFRLIQTMSRLQDQYSAGGQCIYPLTDEQWKPDPALHDAVERALKETNSRGQTIAFWSIRLGGFAVLAGTDEGLAHLKRALPHVQRGARTYPLDLPGHAAYHTPLLAVTSHRAVEQFADLVLQPPAIPLIDGRGHIFKPYLADPAELYGYTFVLQVTHTYDFTHSVRVGLREFGPDCIILLGPGDQLGGAIGQILVADQWSGMNDRPAFSARQKSDPFLLAMGRDEQFAIVTGTQA
ncbi:MAG: ACP S-malonyltransferase [Phycisphaerae bacterium]|nr:ACP S-malonyltransferase [Phycisphaerae bacterium]